MNATVTFQGSIKGVAHKAKVNAQDGSVDVLTTIALEVHQSKLNLNQLQKLLKGTVAVSLEAAQLSLGPNGGTGDGTSDDTGDPDGDLI